MAEAKWIADDEWDANRDEWDDEPSGVGDANADAHRWRAASTDNA